MKKIVASMLSIAVFISFASCSTVDKNDNRDDSEQTVDGASVLDKEDEDTDTEELSDYSPDFTFSTTDRDGNSYDETIFADHELTMINLFEPWCGPCVGEMGDIEALYETYSDAGFYVIGVYSDTGYEADLDEILDENGITYPILHFSNDFQQFQSGFVPTTLFVDRDGHIVTTNTGGDPTYVGSQDYASWESIILELIR